MQVGEEIGRTMKKTADTIANQGKQISESEAVKAIGKVCKSEVSNISKIHCAQGYQEVREAVDIGAGVYKPPKILRKRHDRNLYEDDRPIVPNEQEFCVYKW